MRFARQHIHTETDAQVRDEVTVIDMTRASRLMRVVADLRSFLVAVETLHGGVDVEDPWQDQSRADAREDVAAHPLQAPRFVHAFESAAHHVLADDALHAEQSGVDRVAAHGVDVRIAPVAAKDAQKRGAHDVGFAAATVADVVQRTVGKESFPALARIEELEKEHELALASDGGLWFPFCVKAPAGRVDGPPLDDLGGDRAGLTF